MDLMVCLQAIHGNDRFFDMAPVMPCRQNVTTKQTAQLLTREILRLQEAPSGIPSDRDARFTIKMWRQMRRLLTIQQQLSREFQPQADGQTERTNQTDFALPGTWG